MVGEPGLDERSQPLVGLGGGLEVDPEHVEVEAAGKGYDAGALAAFLDRQPFERLCVEYPKGEQERFPIERVPAGCVVALGVVDVSTTEPESVDELVERTDKAITLVDIDDIAISTNGGFGSVGVRLTTQQQRAKLQLVEMVARYIWGNEL